MIAQHIDVRKYRPQKPARCPWCDGRRQKSRTAMAYVGRRCRRWLCVCPRHGVVKEKVW
jgi:hypothetical protein